MTYEEIVDRVVDAATRAASGLVRENVVRYRDVVRQLLATLPRCWVCEHPATRVAYSKPLAPGPFGVITLPESGAYGQRFSGGRMEADCCDEHEMVDAVGSRPSEYAGVIREASSLLEGML